MIWSKRTILCTFWSALCCCPTGAGDGRHRQCDAAGPRVGHGVQRKPVIVCPADSVQAIEKCAAVVGLHIYEDLDTVQELPLSMGVVAFTKRLLPPPRRRPSAGRPASLPPSSQWRPAARTRRAYTTMPWVAM